MCRNISGRVVESFSGLVNCYFVGSEMSLDWLHYSVPQLRQDVQEVPCTGGPPDEVLWSGQSPSRDPTIAGGGASVEAGTGQRSASSLGVSHRLSIRVVVG